MTLLELRGLTVRRGPRCVVRDVSLRLGAGEMVGLLGPNGAGKTTLMRAALGLIPHSGQASCAALATAERARLVAWMPQERRIAWPVTAERLVALGRLPHAGTRYLRAARDADAVESALRRTDAARLRHRVATELSGGEQTRLLIARLIAQETPLILADEPIAGLDPRAQIETMRLLAGLAAEGRGVLVSLHDLALAQRHCTRLVLMDRGRVVADGTPDAVLTDANLAAVFGITAFRASTPEGPVFQALDTL